MNERAAGNTVNARLDCIVEYSEVANYYDRSVLLALLRCLNLEEALHLLAYSLEHDLGLRDAVVYVFADYEAKGRQRAVGNFIRYVINKYSEIEPKRKVSAHMALEQVYGISSRANKRRVINFLLSQKYVGARRRALKIMDSRSIHENRDAILAMMIDNGDHTAAILILNEYSSEDVYECRKSLIGVLEHGALISRVYLRSSVVDAQCIEELLDIDGICYAYVRAKLNKPISEELAGRIIGYYVGDDRLGLLAWSFGKMKLWTAVLSVAKIRDGFVPTEYDAAEQHVEPVD